MPHDPDRRALRARRPSRRRAGRTSRLGASVGEGGVGAVPAPRAVADLGRWHEVVLGTVGEHPDLPRECRSGAFRQAVVLGLEVERADRRPPPRAPRRSRAGGAGTGRGSENDVALAVDQEQLAVDARGSRRPCCRAGRCGTRSDHEHQDDGERRARRPRSPAAAVLRQVPPGQGDRRRLGIDRSVGSVAGDRHGDSALRLRTGRPGRPAAACPGVSSPAARQNPTSQPEDEREVRERQRHRDVPASSASPGTGHGGDQHRRDVGRQRVDQALRQDEPGEEPGGVPDRLERGVLGEVARGRRWRAPGRAPPRPRPSSPRRRRRRSARWRSGRPSSLPRSGTSSSRVSAWTSRGSRSLSRRTVSADGAGADRRPGRS